MRAGRTIVLAEAGWVCGESGKWQASLPLRDALVEHLLHHYHARSAVLHD